jgi:hypothetical protein
VFHLVEGLEVDDYKLVGQLQPKRRLVVSLVMGLWMAASVLCGFDVLGRAIDDQEFAIAMMAVLAIAFPPVSILMLARRGRRQLHRLIDSLNRRLEGATQYFDSEGFHLQGHHVDETIRWSGYEGLRANDQVALLYLSLPDQPQIVARHMLARPEEWPEFVALLERHLERR